MDGIIADLSPTVAAASVCWLASISRKGTYSCRDLLSVNDDVATGVQDVILAELV